MTGPVNEIGRWMDYPESAFDLEESRSSSEEIECEWLLGHPRSFLEAPLSHAWIVLDPKEPLSRRLEYKDSIYAEVVSLLSQDNLYISVHDLEIIILLLFHDKLYEDREEQEMLKLLYIQGVAANQLKGELRRMICKNLNNQERLDALEMYIDSLEMVGR